MVNPRSTIHEDSIHVNTRSTSEDSIHVNTRSTPGQIGGGYDWVATVLRLFVGVGSVMKLYLFQICMRMVA